MARLMRLPRPAVEGPTEPTLTLDDERGATGPERSIEVPDQRDPGPRTRRRLIGLLRRPSKREHDVADVPALLEEHAELASSALRDRLHRIRTGILGAIDNDAPAGSK